MECMKKLMLAAMLTLQLPSAMMGMEQGAGAEATIIDVGEDEVLGTLIMPGVFENIFDQIVGSVDTPEKILNAIKNLVRVANVNKTLRNKLTPTEIAKLLRNAGADLDAVDVFGHTALHEAASNGLTECVKILLAAGANVNAADENGHTVLHCTVVRDKVECLKILLDRTHASKC